MIDDSPEDLALYSKYLLSSEKSFVVATASSSASGIQMCGVFQPDCLVIDLLIDSLDGLQVLERARERAGYVPTIILTGQGNERYAVESLKRGAWTYLVKGETDPATLAAAVAEALHDSDVEQQLREQRRREEIARVELETAYRRSRFLAEISTVLISSMQREEIVETVVREVVANVADVCFVDLVLDGTLTRVGVRDAGVRMSDDAPARAAHYAPHADGREGVARVLRSGEPALYGPTSLDSLAQYDGDLAALRPRGLHSVIVVPLMFDRAILGTISFAALPPRAAYGTADVEHFLELARRVSTAIANANLYALERQARATAEAAQRRLTIVSQASSLFARSLEWQETLSRLVRTLVPQFADWVGIYVKDEDDERALRLVASRHVDAAADEAYVDLCQPGPPLRGHFLHDAAAHESFRPIFYPEGLPNPKPQASEDEIRSMESLQARGVRSCMAVPIVARGQHMGSIIALVDSERAPLTLDDLSLLEDLGRRVATYLESASIFRRERDIAHTLQRSLLPDAIPSFSELRFATRYLPGTEGVHVGGDWYDAIAINDRSVAFVIGDVSGRGVRAAVIMGKLRATVRAYIFDGSGPAAVLERANRAAESMGFDHFATVLCAILDRQTGGLTFANAGHPPPLLISPEQCAVLDQEPGLPLGVARTAVYSDVTVNIEAGETFVLYTDGLVEHRTRFAADGISELCHQAKAHADHDLEAYVDSLLDAMTGGRHDDDVALVAVRRLENAQSAAEGIGRSW